MLYVITIRVIILLTELRVSVKLLRSLTGNNAELRPRLPLPFGVRESNSSVGESQNLYKEKETLQNDSHNEIILKITVVVPSRVWYSLLEFRRRFYLSRLH